jgi:release factor glutamine methyltransferase
LSQPTPRIDDNVLKKILHAIIPTSKGIYSPSEDSFLMLDAISNISVERKEVLDVGTGSGILGLFCALRGASVTVTDIDETALLFAQKAAQALGVRLNVVLSDIFSDVSGRFDLVLFNPPYLPSANLEDRTVDGGKRGAELTRRFIETLSGYLKPDGSALLLLSSLNDPPSLIAQHPEFNFSVLAKRALFLEELQVLNLRLRQNVVR